MRILLTTALVFVAGTRVAAQWYVGADISASRYGGSSHDTSSGHAASDGRPGDATVLHVRIDRHWRRFGIALRLARSTPGLSVSGQGVNVTDKTSGGLTEVAAIVSTRVGGIGSSGAVRLELGPALHLWSFADVRSRLGATTALAYEWLIAGHFSGAVRLDGMLSKSWFDPGDVPPEYERRVTWRYGVGLGLRYRL